MRTDRSDISYHHRKGKWSVRQVLENISLYDFEGDPTEVLEKFKKEVGCWKETYLGGPSKLCALYYTSSCLDGRDVPLTTLNVKLDKIELDLLSTGHDGYELRLIGTREAIQEELLALEADRLEEEKQNNKRKLEEFERLKKELGK